jgi:hypothetical protein
MNITENNKTDLRQRLSEILSQVEESTEQGCGCGGGCGCHETEEATTESCNCDCDENSSCCKN